MPPPFDPPLKLSIPGLFVTATDTEVGKTVTTCAVIRAMRRQRPQARIAASKPMASGCQRDPASGALIPEDALTIQSALGEPQGCPLDRICPCRFEAALSPAVAAEREGALDWAAIRSSLEALGSAPFEALLIEGVGGLLAPLDERFCVRELMASLGYPALIVCRSGLGTLNHTAMTVELLRHAGLPIVGLVMNDHGGGALSGGGQPDESLASNERWLQRLTGLPVLAQLPKLEGSPSGTDPSEALWPALSGVDWWSLLGPSQPVA
jgi:dethiobiotin synthetase